VAGLRKLVLGLAVLGCGTALALAGKLTPAYVDLAMWVLVAVVGGNVGEHFASGKRAG